MDNLRKLQLIELSILKDVAALCDKYQLRYYLIGGTLLGAVRHEGFIPWDDDIDIVMFRKDYDSLFGLVEKEYPNKYFVQRFETDKNYTRYIAKIRLIGTKHIEFENSKIDMNQGIYIDIFPIDYVINDKKELEKRGKKLRRLFAVKNIKHHSFNPEKKKRLLSALLRPLSFFVTDRYLNRQFKLVCERDNDKRREYVTNFASHFKWEKQLFPANYYGEGVYLTFENGVFRCPLNYNEILTRLYGSNYMDIPPLEKRESHKVIEVDFGDYGKLL